MREQSHYKIIEASISSEKLGDTQIDVKSNILELVLFESLNKPYVSGLVAIQDNTGVFDGIKIQGTERIHIVIQTEDQSLSPVIDRSFILSGVETNLKSSGNDRSSMYVFNLVEEHVFLSMSKKISQTAQGNFVKEITKILNTHLDKSIDLSYSRDPIQQNIKSIIPYMHPLEACNWLKDRITSEVGSPYFLYGSIHDTNLRLGNLDVILSQSAFNSKRPYIYSPSNTQLSEDGDFDSKNFQISTMKTEKMHNTFRMMETGSIGALYNNTNLNTGRVSSSHVSLRETLQNMVDNNIINTNNIFDDQFELKDVPVDGYDARIIHTITSSGTYYEHKSYHDEYDINQFKKKVERVSILNSLYKNQFEITVPGVGFIISKAGVGDIINLSVVGDNNLTEDADKLLDGYKSGDFVILNTRHTFKDNRHDVALRIGKL